MRRHVNPRVRHMLSVALRRFPELNGKTIHLGYTRATFGTALMPESSGRNARMGIRLNPRKLTYNTVGHELTHLVQGLSQVGRTTQKRSKRARVGKMPGGEVQCDIWTLARSELFCDEAPLYLDLPRAVRNDWPRSAKSVRALCIAAIEKRRTYRLYIRWLNAEIKKLSNADR